MAWIEVFGDNSLIMHGISELLMREVLSSTCCMAGWGPLQPYASLLRQFGSSSPSSLRSKGWSFQIGPPASEPYPQAHEPL